MPSLSDMVALSGELRELLAVKESSLIHAVTTKAVIASSLHLRSAGSSGELALWYVHTYIDTQLGRGWSGR